MVGGDELMMDRRIVHIRVVGQAIIYIQNISTNNQESDRKKIPPHKKFLIMLCSV